MAFTWVKVSTNITEHPKMLRVPRSYRWAFIELLCYCGRNLTDGEIPADYARRNCDPEELEALASAGFIIPSEHGYRIHDYLDWQTPGEEVREKNEKRARAGRKGGLRSGEARRAQAAKQTGKQNGSKTEANGQAKPNLDVDVDVDVEEVPKREARKRATSAPESLPITDAMRQWAATNAAGIDLESETATFLDHARANGKTFKDWTAAWRTWMKRAVEFKRRDGRINGASPPTTTDKIVALQQRIQARQAAGIS